MDIVCLASGEGTNFEAIAQAIEVGTIPYSRIKALICNKKEALVVERALDRGIPAHVIDATSFSINGKLERAAYERELLKTLGRYTFDYVCLAGYMLILGKAILQKYPKILNIHPSLLPKFPGLHAQKQALDAKEKKTGVSVHWVTEDLDLGPVVEQAEIVIAPNETLESLKTKMKPLEHATYIKALKSLAENHKGK